jgi:hypothetical protein
MDGCRQLTPQGPFPRDVLGPEALALMGGDPGRTIGEKHYRHARVPVWSPCMRHGLPLASGMARVVDATVDARRAIACRDQKFAGPGRVDVQAYRVAPVDALHALLPGCAAVFAGITATPCDRHQVTGWQRVGAHGVHVDADVVVECLPCVAPSAESQWSGRSYPPRGTGSATGP